jgi:hypothetical protein
MIGSDRVIYSTCSVAGVLLGTAAGVAVGTGASVVGCWVGGVANVVV